MVAPAAGDVRRYKRRARLNCISHLLSLIPYKKVRQDKVKLPERQKAKGYVPRTDSCLSASD